MLVTTLTKGKDNSKKNDTTFFENKLLDFITAKDPLLEILQWGMDRTHVFIDEKPENAYERIFGETIKKYNAKQKCSDRRIGKKYYEKKTRNLSKLL